MSSPQNAIAQLFQNIQGGGGDTSQAPPNPLEAMMNPQAGPPQDPNVPQAPSGISPAPQDPYQAKAAEIEAQRKALKAQLDQADAILRLDPAKALPEALKTFDKYNEDQYQQTYGGGGVLGTAGRALANLLSGVQNKGQTIKQTLTTQNLKKYQEAVAAANAQTQAQKAAAAASAQNTQQRLTDLNQQQAALDEQRKLGQADTGLGIKQQIADQVKTKESPHPMSGADLIAFQGGKDTTKDANGNDLKIDPTKYYITINDDKSGQLIGAKPTAVPQELRTSVAWAKDKEGKWTQVHVNGRGEVTGTTPGLQPPTSYTGTVTSKTVFKTAHDLDGNEYFIPVTEGSATSPANGGPPQAPQAKGGLVPGATVPGFPAGTVRGGVAATATIKDTRAFARSAQPHLDEVNGLINDLSKTGDIGVVMSRWNDIMSGTVGADPTQEAKYTQLREGVGLIETVLGRIHGGARGGGSITMLERFDKYINSGKMDEETLKGALKEAKFWIDGYTHLGETPEKTPLQKIKDKYGIQ